MTVRVLVVAPEGPGLLALRDGLRTARPGWQVLTATSRRASLAVCGAVSVQAVVVDTGFGEESVALLDELRQHQPDVGRVALALGRQISEAHRTLPRNPPPFPLALAVQAAIDQVKREGVDPVSRLIANVHELPSSPATWTKLRTQLADPDVEIRVLAETISRDVGTTARVLRLVNSAFVGLRRQILDVREAITVLGLRTISSVVLSAEVMNTFEQLRRLPGLDVDTLSAHGLASGVVARALSPNRGAGEDAFVAGLLQDVGQLALASAAPEEFRQCLAEAVWQNRPLHEVERERLGCDHAQAGAALLVLWQLPDPVVSAVAGTHSPLPDPVDAPLDVAATVRLAHCLTSTRWGNWRDPGERGELGPLADEADRVLAQSGLTEMVDEIGLVLAGELSGTQAALRA